MVYLSIIEEQAKLVQAKVEEIQSKLHAMTHLCMLVMRKEVVDEVIYQFSDEQKQGLIAQYAELKASVVSLVEELP